MKAHLIDGKWKVKRRNGQKYREETVANKDVYIIQRAYRRHKVETDFTNMVCTVKNAETNELSKYCLFVNDRKGGSDDQNFQIACHGNAVLPHSLAVPLIRTKPSVLAKMKSDLKEGRKPYHIYTKAIDASGGPFQSSSQSAEPRNPKQV